MQTRAHFALVLSALVGALSGPTARAQTAYMVADLGEVVPYLHDIFSGTISEHLAVDGKFYFFHDDGVHGQELWRSDGSALGTFLIRDLCPGTCGSRYPAWNSMAALGDQVVFAADDGVHGLELWLTNGTALGTHMVADLFPGYGSAYIENLTSTGTQVFFVARRDAMNSSLWRTDGTAKGTYSITPPGIGNSFAPTSIHPGPGFLYLCNASWAGQSGLWRSDGSSAGTTFVAAVECWQNSIAKRGTMAVSPTGVLYFYGSPLPSNDDELWRSDGTSAGTWQVKDLVPGPGGSSPAGIAWMGSYMLFTADDETLSTALWRSDGTEAGTFPIPLADDASARSGFAGGWIQAGDRYYFTANDPDHGYEPWVYDGVGASRIADLFPGPDSALFPSLPNFFFPYFEAFGDDAVFAATDGLFGTELWRTDGSAAGTVRISDIAPGAESLHLPVYWGLVTGSLGGRPLVIEHRPDTGERLWRLDPTGSAMELVDTVNAQSSSFERRGTDRLSLFESVLGSECFEGAGTSLFFEHRHPEAAELDLLRTDGATSEPDTIFQALPLREEPCGHQDDRLLYSQVTEPPGTDDTLLAVNSNAGGFEVLLAEGFLNSRPAFLDLGDRQVFGWGSEVYSTDASSGGTSLLATEVGEDGARLRPFLGEVVIAAQELWITDVGEPTGKRLLLSDDDGSRYIGRELAPLASKLVFFASDVAHGEELWTSDGTAEGTALLVDAVPGPGSLLRGVSPDRFFVEYNDAVLVGADTYAVFAGVTAPFGDELWVTDGTVLGTGLLRDIYPGDYPSTPRQLTRLGNKIVFSAEDEEHGLELWVTDGTYPGTVLLKDIAPGFASSVPDDLGVYDGILYFSAWSPGYGREAWKSDGTSAGTVRISDVAPGPLSSSPQRFARAGDRLYFSATDQVHGFELWAISDDGTVPLFLDGFEGETTDRWSSTLP